jgi:hypothetical protein
MSGATTLNPHPPTERHIATMSSINDNNLPTDSADNDTAERFSLRLDPAVRRVAETILDHGALWLFVDGGVVKNPSVNKVLNIFMQRGVEAVAWEAQEILASQQVDYVMWGKLADWFVEHPDADVVSPMLLAPGELRNLLYKEVKYSKTMTLTREQLSTSFDEAEDMAAWLAGVVAALDGDIDGDTDEEEQVAA